MKSSTTSRFWKGYENLPIEIKLKAKETYALFEKDPYYPSLRFKQIFSDHNIYSVRITKDYRALGVLSEQEIVWFWIGSHSDYDVLLQRMR